MEWRPAVQSTVLDITLRKRYEDRLQYQANFDPVTDLPNRSLALDQLVGGIEAARRRATRVSVLFIDVDHFKKINDTLGHAAGDRFLRQVAQRLKSSVRQMDTVARLGGDEFVVMLNDVRLRSDAEAVAAKIVDACASAVHARRAGSVRHLEYRRGVLSRGRRRRRDCFAMQMPRCTSVRRKAGAKHASSPPNCGQRSHNRVRLEVDLRQAIERGELALHYQPLVDIRTGDILGAEALLRWFSTEHGTMSPDQFVRLAEETGLIVPIGEWAPVTGCREMRHWIDAGARTSSVCRSMCPADSSGSIPAASIRGAPRDNRLDPHPRVGDHRKPVDRRTGRDQDDDRSAGWRWGAPRHRRLRHRLRVAELPQPLSARHPENRSLVHRRHACRRRAINPC